MAIRRYNIWHADTGADVTLDVDHDVLTVELATQINNFAADSSYRVDAADGDVVAAVIRLAGSCFLGYVLDTEKYLGIDGMQQTFDNLEGWPPNGQHGITIVDFDGRPDLDSALLDLTEVEPE